MTKSDLIKPNTFYLTDEENSKYEKWKKKLEKKNKKGKHYMYWVCFSHSSGIGLNIKGMRNDGEEIDLTDYSTW